ncbi:MAG: serine/threonine protein kinase, partial [Planctomycetota bacterium]
VSHERAQRHGKGESEVDGPHIGGFRVIERLGRDGQGEVYRAVQTSLGRQVALKIPKQLAPGIAEQFKREAYALGQVNHPNVVRVYEAGEGNGCLYFAMELIEGRDLARTIKRLREGGEPPKSRESVLRQVGLAADGLSADVEKALRGTQPYERLVALWIAQATDGLDAALRSGVLHRDIKPANLMIAGDGRLVVVDFGLARAMDASQTRSFGATGTYPYIAPERIAGDFTPDHRADIWALGATLYELLALRRAYERTGDEVLADIATRDPIPLRRLRPEVPEALARICRRAMQRDPNDRYQTWREFGDDLRAFIAGSQGTSKRPLLLPAAAAAALVVMVVALAFSGWSPGMGEKSADGAKHADAIGASAPQPAPSETSLAANEQASQRPPKGEPETEPPPLATAPPERTTAEAPCPPTGAPVVLIVCNQDLNTRDDDRELIAGSLPREDLLAGHLERNGCTVRAPLRRPRVWTHEEALAAARESDATAVVLLTMLATPGTPFDVSYSEQPVYPWTVALRGEVIRVCDGVAAPCGDEIRAAAAARGVARVVGRERLLPDRTEATGEIALETYDAAGLYYGAPADDQKLIVKIRDKIMKRLWELFPQGSKSPGRAP